jgi:ribosome-binding ATPase YchF (GTP1/OBG family)
MERLAEERKKGGGRDKAVIDRELALFERFKVVLEADQPLREVAISAEDEKTLAGFGFLTRKPMLVVLNIAEGQAPPVVDYSRPHTGVVLCRKLDGIGFRRRCRVVRGVWIKEPA